MGVKIIDATAIPDVQKLAEAIKLATDIKELHTEVTQKTDLMESKKTILRDRSTDMFFGDIVDGVTVELHECHDYPTADGNVRVEFKVKGKPLDELSGKPAGTFLREQFGAESFNKLFTEVTTYTITADTERQLGQAVKSPELFRIALKDLSSEQYMLLVREHPDWVKLDVTDVPKYATTYPESVSGKTIVTVKNNFIENLAKVEGPILKRLRKFIMAFLKPCIAPAVVCGNRSKKA